MATLKRLVCEALKKRFQVVCSPEDILDLDSSTTTKFSRHVLFRPEGVAFRNNR